jgi:hypothetical protein
MQAGLRALGRAFTASSCFEKTEGRLESLKVSVSGNTATSEPINPDETGMSWGSSHLAPQAFRQQA